MLEITIHSLGIITSIILCLIWAKWSFKLFCIEYGVMLNVAIGLFIATVCGIIGWFVSDLFTFINLKLCVLFA